MTSETTNKSSKKVCLRCQGEFPVELSLCPNDQTPLTELKTDNLVGTVLGDRYEVLDVIGGGGMGLVYLAKQKLLNRNVAIKVLHKAQITGIDALKRFQIEAQAASALSSPHIVSIHDFNVSADGAPYMVMDFLDGKSLDAILETESRLSVARGLHIFIQTCNALAHAHSNGIIHRDIKPSNVILIDLEGHPDFVKIVDFGIAKLTNSTDPQGNLTRTGEVFGSPLYMSPEQWRGQKLDARTDIYSLGAMMYRCFSGVTMFPKGDVMQLAFNHVNELPVTFAAIGVNLPPALEQIILKTLAKDPDARFQSMLELSDALKRLQSNPSSADPTVTAGNTQRITQVAPEASQSLEPPELSLRSGPSWHALGFSEDPSSANTAAWLQRLAGNTKGEIKPVSDAVSGDLDNTVATDVFWIQDEGEIEKHRSVITGDLPAIVASVLPSQPGTSGPRTSQLVTSLSDNPPPDLESPPLSAVSQRLINGLPKDGLPEVLEVADTVHSKKSAIKPVINGSVIDKTNPPIGTNATSRFLVKAAIISTLLALLSGAIFFLLPKSPSSLTSPDSTMVPLPVPANAPAKASVRVPGTAPGFHQTKPVTLAAPNSATKYEQNEQHALTSGKTESQNNEPNVPHQHPSHVARGATAHASKPEKPHQTGQKLRGIKNAVRNFFRKL